jgi:hypothetical protein
MTSMQKKLVIITSLIAIVILGVSGCASVVKYDLKDVPITPPDLKRQGMRVAVAPLEDIRPEEEKNARSNRYKTETTDAIFKDGDVCRCISEALVTHFNYVKLFKTAELVDKSAMAPSADVLEKMKNLGYDALFTGRVKHFYGVGYVTSFDRVTMPLATIPILGLISSLVVIPIMLIQDNRNEGYVEIVDAQLTDTASGSVIWSGSFLKIKKMKYNDTYAVKAVSVTLKEIVNEIVEEIEAAYVK